MSKKQEMVYLLLSEIKPHPNNPRKNDDAVDKVAESLKEFGAQNPIIVDKDMVIIAGHTRYKAAKKVGLKEFPVIVAKGLTDEQVKAYRLADNKTGEFAEWDEEALNDELFNILDIDMERFGFDLESVEDLLDDGEVEAEVEFTEELREEHNYVVLYFDNEVDWLQAKTLFDIKSVAALPTKRGGRLTKKFTRKGIGRVLNGPKAIERIIGHVE